MEFEIGKIYNRRKDIHDIFGGQRQGGISTPAKAPFIFLFTGNSGQQYGYQDGWGTDNVFLYTGEGRIGDMQFRAGNKAIRDHGRDGKDLLVFEALGKGDGYRFLGQFTCTRMVKILERTEIMGDVPTRRNGCGKTLRVKSGPCNVVLRPVWNALPG
jgi:hypothetical protein